MSKQQHWYDRDGKAVFEVPKAKGGGMRATTIADARKLGLYPSVTTVLSVLAKPQLVDWQLGQVAGKAYSNPPQDGESQEDYARRIISASQEQVGEAADLGTAIHAALEAHFQGLPVPDGYSAYVDPVAALIAREGITFLEHELRLVNADVGYAGTTDAVIKTSDGRLGILDFKSRKTKPGERVSNWETEPMQIAAYGMAKWGKVPDTGANLYISTTEKGRVQIVQYSHEELQAAWDAFLCATRLWQYLKGYKPPA